MCQTPRTAPTSSVALASGLGRASEVFLAFLRLGLTSFGGPIAHIGYFHAEFVERRQWLDDGLFARLLALAQFIPGPASSQLGFAIGLHRAGVAGALAAFVAFTLPSALLIFSLAVVGAALGGPWWEATLHALKLLAVVVVADGLYRMGRQLTPDARRLTIAALCAGLVIVMASAAAQLLVILLGALAGLLLLRGTHDAAMGSHASASSHSTRSALVAATLFAGLLGFALTWTDATPSLLSIAAAFARAGSLVFGGGHVVLPLLERSLVESGWLGSEAFLTGYGAAQAVPGPMFSVAAYFGAVIPIPADSTLAAMPNALTSLVAVLAIFAPGFLLLYAALPSWDRVLGWPAARRAVAGINAAVVGLLAAAFYRPVVTTGVITALDLVIVMVGFALQHHLRRPTLWVLAWCLGGAVIARTW